MNVAEHVERGARLHPDRTALRFEGADLSYRALDRRASRLASVVSRLGIQAGDHVGLYLPNIPAFAEAYLALMKIGAVAVSISSALKTEEVEYILKDSGARLLFTTAELYREVAPVRAGCSGLEAIIIAEGAVPELPALERLIEAEARETSAVPRDKDDAAAILYTSGTTGRPKGAVLTHGNVVSNMTATARHMQMEPNDVLLLFLPLFHCFGQNFVFNASLSAGSTIVLMRRFDPKEALAAIAAHRVSVLLAVPTIYIGLLKGGVQPAAFASVRTFFSAAATMPEEVAKQWLQRMGRPILEGYGLTETSPFAAFNHDRAYRPGSIGVPINGVEMKVVGEDDREVPPGTWGEILIRGPNVMKGYFGKEEESAHALRGGWFHSGDIGFVSDDGYFYLVDRVKDMINAAGFKVWPREVEEVIYRHPGVKEVVVIGVPDELKGEAVRAYVVPEAGKSVEPEAVIAFCREKIAGYKVPREVEIVEEIPKSPTGKILKRVLRAQAIG